MTKHPGLYATCAERVELTKRVEELEAENAKLMEVVKKLPKTADGVPVAPGMTVWVPSSVDVEWEGPSPFDGYVAEAVAMCDMQNGYDMGRDVGTVDWAAEWLITTPRGTTYSWVSIDAAYSTREAAEAAQAAKGGESNA